MVRVLKSIGRRRFSERSVGHCGTGGNDEDYPESTAIPKNASHTRSCDIIMTR